MTEQDGKISTSLQSLPTARVAAPARLHLGFVDLNGELGRRFGSIGLAITGCDAVVSAAPAPSLDVRGVETARARRAAAATLEWLKVEDAAQVTVESVAPAHAGLGSGTQLALAVAAACTHVHGRASDARTLAPVVDRGHRSGIGLAAFAAGGLLVDGGRGRSDLPPPLLARLEFPEAWRALLVFDDTGAGLHGGAERAAFSTLPPMTASEAAELARWCLIGLLPAVAEADFDAFARAVGEIQRRIGTYFAPAQGGAVFTSSRVDAAVHALAREFEALGTGQSSWGPTAFVFARSEADARAMQVFAQATFAHERGLRFEVVAGCNHGARISESTVVSREASRARRLR